VTGYFKKVFMGAWMAEVNAASEPSDTTYGCQDVGFDLYLIKRLGS